MSKSSLCGLLLPQPVTFLSFRAPSSVNHLLTMPQGKECVKKGSLRLPTSEMASSLTTAAAAASSPPRRQHSSQLRNPRTTEVMGKASPVLMDIEEEDLKPAARDSDSEMAVSPQTVGSTLVLGTPESMNLSMGNLSPLAARTLFVDTPSPPAAPPSLTQPATIPIESEPLISSLPATSPDKDTESSEDPSIWASPPTSTRPNDFHVGPYEYQMKTSNWLFSVMRSSMGDTSAPGIPTIDHVHLKPRPERVPSKTPAPTRAYAVRYDLCITVAEGDDPVLQARMALMQILEKIQTVDKHAIIYPWSMEDRKQRLPVLTTPGDFPSLVSNIWSYAHRLFIRSDGGTYYPKKILGLMAPPASIMANIGWWFKSTDQGMWPMDLQDVEETVCLGWLLYSADEFDRAALCYEIWQFSGVLVALCFRDIDDGVAKGTANHTIVKALHLDINKADQPELKK